MVGRWRFCQSCGPSSARYFGAVIWSPWDEWEESGVQYRQPQPIEALLHANAVDLGDEPMGAHLLASWRQATGGEPQTSMVIRPQTHKRLSPNG
jgi:hypothetical protein